MAAVTGSAAPTLAIVGATGAVGTVVRDVLPIRRHIWGDVRLAAGPEDVGSVHRVAGEDLTVEALTPDFFDGVDVAVVDIPPDISAQWAGVAVERGAVVIDNSPTFRRDPQVPLVVPEINPEAVRERSKGIIANPGATVMTMIDVLAVLHRQWQLTELVVTSFQAASGLGRAGMTRLRDEMEVVGADRELGMRPGDVRRAIEHELGPSMFGGPLALNVLPFAGSHVGDGWSSEESKIRQETRKILGMPELRVSATCVRVPVISAHSVSVHATFARSIPVEKARQALVEAPAVVVMDDPEHGEFPTPVDMVGADPRFVGRMRQAIDFPRTLDLFVVGDNLRKGAALNMIQTAELVAETL
ncbi:aspartate semialdehyde dehydrogenase [Knoellia remsis]|uniref:Aspartate semialdehyde dehydrogenase n=1 Tax=Knoellia remsis TaxID=407159 RepID=A0A2T0UNF7_9MICO|nr:aspartate-semialdehyde dehydrogenase [Knoellia remsis]PRY59450.1 aspartate semialdehyde dehydrogenase [Knoellia remsis]